MVAEVGGLVLECYLVKRQIFDSLHVFLKFQHGMESGYDVDYAHYSLRFCCVLFLLCVCPHINLSLSADRSTMPQPE